MLKNKKDEGFVNRLRKLTIKYDLENGRYPENPFEGIAFYRWVAETMKVKFVDYKDQLKGL